RKRGHSGVIGAFLGGGQVGLSAGGEVGVAGHAFLLVVFERGVPAVAEASDLLLVVHAGQGRRNHPRVGGVAIVVEPLGDLGGVHPFGGLVCRERRAQRVRAAVLLRGGVVAGEVEAVRARAFLAM